MREIARVSTALLACASPVLSHDIVNPHLASPNPVPLGRPGYTASAWGELVQDPTDRIAVTGLTQIPAAPSCVSPLDAQFSLARGFAGANGFVISNGYVEDFDDDGPALGDPTGCATSSGSIGSGPCDGVDPTLALALQAGYGAALPVPTSNAAIFRVDFEASAPTTLDVSYTFATFEDPQDPAFFDSFGIFLDGTLVAGGVSRNPGLGPFGGAVPGADPWTLAPSAGLPAPGFNRPPLPPSFLFPAATTGLRTVPLLIPAGVHALEFHVADGGGPAAAPCAGSPTPGGDALVNGALFFGLTTYDSGIQGNAGVCGGASIAPLGHPAVTVPPHGPNGTGFQDFQVRETGAVPGSFAFALLGTEAGSVPVVGSCHLLLDPLGAWIGAFPAGVVPARGEIDWPAVPAAIPPGYADARAFVQIWNLLPGGGFANTKGMRVVFGPS